MFSTGTEFNFHPPDSSTESNDERSPQPPRRPPHMQQPGVYPGGQRGGNVSAPIHQHLMYRRPLPWWVEHPMHDGDCPL